MLVLKQQELLESDGLSVNFKDLTGSTSSTAYGIGGNANYADIDACRFKIGTATTLTAVTTITYGSTFTQYHEYIKTVGASSTVDGKTMVVGSVFIPQITGLSVPSGDTWQATGYYNPVTIGLWLPTAAQVALNLDINELGQSGSTVEDNIYVTEYEVYVDLFTGTLSAVSGNSYIVMTSTATYNGDTYRFGEKFTAVNTGSIVASGFVAIFYASSTAYSTLSYTLLTSINANVTLKGQSANSNYWDGIYKIQSQYDALLFSCSTLNVDFTISTDLLTSLQNQVTYLTNNSM